MSHLSRLLSLELGGFNHAVNFPPLRSFRLLRRLSVESCSLPADGLGDLTALRSLAVTDTAGTRRNWNTEVVTLLDSVLPRLQQLTHLQLGGLPRLPTSLTALHSLRSFSMQVIDDVDSVLPMKQWAGQLQRLAAPVQLLVASLPVPTAAPQLCRLRLLWTEYPYHMKADAHDMLQCLRWAARCPSLRRLELDGSCLPKCRAAALEIQQNHPHLVVDLGLAQPRDGDREFESGEEQQDHI
jgi:hypothetical protein